MGRQLRPLLAASRSLVLDCGDGVRLQAFHSEPARTALTGSARVAVLLHGWEGSADSLYVLSLAAQLFERGFDVIRLNLRDHGGTHHLNRELFHSCRLPEVVGAVRCVEARFPGARLHLAGFSLGGNFMLRVAAEAEAARLDIARVVAISPVLDPVATLEALESGFSAYHAYFMRKWTRSLHLKQTAWPRDYDFAALSRRSRARQPALDLRGLTAELVRRFTTFASLEDYLNGYAIVGPRLAALTVPCTLITALDDPIIPARDLERLAPSAALTVVATRWGGHCGFLDHLARWTWAERRAASELDAASGPVRALPPGRDGASPRSS
jgi:predicted alpha/beta-fold hydrolase